MGNVLSYSTYLFHIPYKSNINFGDLLKICIWWDFNWWKSYYHNNYQLILFVLQLKPIKANNWRMSILRKVWLWCQYSFGRPTSHWWYTHYWSIIFVPRYPVCGFGHFHHITTVPCCWQSTFIDKLWLTFLCAGPLVDFIVSRSVPCM